MKRRIYMLLIIALGALLQQTLPGLALFGGMKPPILAAMALHHALHKGAPDYWFAVLFAAILQDGLDLGSFGPALIAFPLMSQLAHRIRNEIFSDGLVTQLVLGAAMGLFTAFTALLIFSITGQRSVAPGLILLRLLSATLLGIITLPVVSHTVQGLESLIPKPREYRWR
jgi:cell shape-determining protein MreD